jgi:hypothetical protein
MSEDKAFFWKGISMSDNNVTQKSFEVKLIGQVVECGSLDVFLSFLRHQPVLLIPLQRTVSSGPQLVRQWGVHLTAHAGMRDGPIYYAMFHAATAYGIAQGMGLTFPYQLHGKEALERGNQLQDELIQCLRIILSPHPRVSEVVTPARYRLPDEWVWAMRSTSRQIVLSEQHWTASA